MADSNDDEVSAPLTSLIVGDPHFKAKNILEGLDFIQRLVDVAKARQPSFIVVLGDILDTHEVVRIPPHKLAASLIEQLSRVAPTYVLIGNHDLINHSQFLTDNHIFNPMKKWPNVFIADTIPLVLEIEDSRGDERTFVFCPYTPPGRFSEALNKLIPEGQMWDLADCIFAHQEFEGCKMSKITSSAGDVWDPAYPPVISGHIHDAQTVGENVFYPGSAIQHTFGESAGKKIWFVNWEAQSADDGDTEAQSAYEAQGFSVEKINLGMKAKRTASMNVDELLGKEKNRRFLDTLQKVSLKVKLTGTSDEFKKFRRSRFSSTLKQLGVKFSYNLAEDEELDAEGLARATRKDVSYREVFRELVSKRTPVIQNEYRTLFGSSPTRAGHDASEDHGVVELVFVDESESESAASRGSEDERDIPADRARDEDAHEIDLACEE